MDELQQIKDEIKEIKERNARVEADKAWETSLFRKILVAVLTYLVVVLFFIIAELPKPFINALVPTLGFLLSTLSISFFKKLWLKNRL
jgi:preprotein translocase subunit SecF